jgi:flagellar hook-associated protein 3 FlgL
VSTRITQAMIARGTLGSIQDVAFRLSDTQRKMATGREITRPSDDPFGTSRAISLRTELDGLQQLERNIAEADGWLTVTDSALDKMTGIVQRVRELTVAGASDSSGPTARASMADEIDQLIQALKQEANASYGNRYVFSGTQTETKAYDPAGSDAFQGDTLGIAREIGPGVAVRINVDARSILGDGDAVAGNDGELLDTLRGISAHLRGGTAADNDALRGSDLRALDANLQDLLRTRASVGALQKRLEAAGARLGETQETVKTLLSTTEDADMAKTLIDFSTQQSVYQSALKAGANIVQSSLLDFLR